MRHPVGATGTRIVATMTNHLEDTARYVLAAIREDGGMANAMVLERA